MYRLWLLTIVSALLTIQLCGALPFKFQLTPYAPVQAQCPVTPLARPATGLSADEAFYIQQRYLLASQALQRHFIGLNTNRTANDTFPAYTAKMPLVAMASSGGSVRSLLTGAGIIQAMDGRDTAALTSPVSGLWQGVSYHAGLSGGAWLVSAVAGNGGATISTIAVDPWESSFENPSWLPVSRRGPDIFADLFLDILAKAWSYVH